MQAAFWAGVQPDPGLFFRMVPYVLNRLLLNGFRVADDSQFMAQDTAIGKI